MDLAERRLAERIHDHLSADPLVTVVLTYDDMINIPTPTEGLYLDVDRVELDIADGTLYAVAPLDPTDESPFAATSRDDGRYAPSDIDYVLSMLGVAGIDPLSVETMHDDDVCRCGHPDCGAC